MSAGLQSAEIIAVGSEMLGSVRMDTNSLFIADQLSAIGIHLRAKSVVGDDRELIADFCRRAMSRADLVVLTGGLGPTDDDLTREAVAQALGVGLAEDAAVLAGIEARFARRGMTMPGINRRQAQILDGAAVLRNELGTAPGQWVERGSKVIVLLPGPPRELQPMFRTFCERLLGPRTGGACVHRAVLFITGRTESHVDEAVQPVYSIWRTATPPIDTTILATPGQIELHLSLRSSDRARAEGALRAASEEIAALLGDDVFSRDGRPMEVIVGDLLRHRGLTLAAAESCTGGLLLSRLTDVPGSSAYVAGGAVLYSNALKESLAGVPEPLIAAHGAVSEPVAVAMAEGIRERTGADVSVGITGIAGPGGGTAEKPVGTVAIAVLAKDDPARVRTHRFTGGRGQIKWHATQAALDTIRRALAPRR